MQKRSPRRFPRFLKRHLISIIAIIVALGASGGFLYWYMNLKNTEIAKTQQDSKALTVSMDKKITEIKARKAAELKAKQEAEAKEAARKAAEAAEAARIATEASAKAIKSANCNTSKSHNNPASIDVVVNKKHCIQPVMFAPGDLVSSYGATLSAKAITAFNQLYAAASAAGQPFAVTSSYRSYNDQISTYNYWVNTSGVAGADTYSARPGYSEHQTGLAFDVSGNGRGLSDFGGTTQYQWLLANAADYGFIQRYYAGYETITGYSAEEWHYRYVGVTVAKDMQARGIKTLEQYWNIAGGNY